MKRWKPPRYFRFTPHVSRPTSSFWSGRWDLNPRQPAWKAGTLPLSYARPSLECTVLSSKPGFSFAQCSAFVTCLRLFFVVGRQGFEPWKPMATDLQSAPFGHLGTCPKIPAHNTINKSKRSTYNCLFHPNDEKDNVRRSTHSFPLLIE